MSDQQWTPPSAPGYAFPSAPPPSGYYSYPNAPQPSADRTPEYSPNAGEHFYEPHNQSYSYNPYAYAPPPPPSSQYQSQGYDQRQPAPNPSGEMRTTLEYTFQKSDQNGWHVFDPNRSLVFDVTYKKAPIFKHDGCEVHHGINGVRQPFP